MRRLAKRSLLLLTALGGLAVLAVLLLLSASTVETSAHGAPIRLRVPVVVGDMAFPITVANGQPVSIPGFLDGPIVRREDDGWSATWFCEDRAHHAKGSGEAMHLECAGETHVFSLQKPKIPAAIAPRPSRVAVLSDLEGNATFLDAALRKLGIVDDAGAWSYGTGHLVILGDSVDRGRDVFAVLWRLHGLSLQAEAAGGALHVLLGNHEQYVLRTNLSRANHEHLHALNAMGGYQHAFAADTIIGGWLRQQPVLIKLGSVLFAHAGISPDVVRTGLSIEELNAAMRSYWEGSPGQKPQSAALDAVLASTGVTQYRGYFREMDGTYPMAGDADVQLGLEHFGATEVVVAHTIVDRIQTLHEGRVRAVDVNSEDARPEVLTYEDGLPRIVHLGIGRELSEPERGSRGFSLTDADDRALLAAMYRDIRRLSTLPFPY